MGTMRTRLPLLEETRIPFGNPQENPTRTLDFKKVVVLIIRAIQGQYEIFASQAEEDPSAHGRTVLTIMNDTNDLTARVKFKSRLEEVVNPKKTSNILGSGRLERIIIQNRAGEVLATLSNS